jgi:peptidoglycan/xylan/chitin deacetylase (PgdA/CDA1 family)
MRKNFKAVCVFAFWGMLLVSCSESETNVGKTEITKFQHNKKGAISITYDDATINQFRQALPIMDTLGFKGTFYINTADIPGSQFPPKFLGRPLATIIKETASVPTDTTNLFERASALRFLDIPNAIELHNRAGSLYESGKLDESLKTVDEGFAAARKKRSTKEIRPVLLTGDLITWPEIKAFAARGHEFGNHTISHPRLAVLDEQNMLYELEKCKEEIYHQLGEEHTFSAECPFGNENERVMEYAYKVHHALRNRMPEPFLEEYNRGSSKTPANSDKEYTQWQRGPLQKTSLQLMKSWVDTLLMYDNVWLVLTFHGIDGVGWEAKPHQELKEYFTYMKEREKDLWVATFKDVTKYIRERMNAKIESKKGDGNILVSVTTTLDKNFYNVPLTLKTYVEPDWEEVTIKQGDDTKHVKTSSDEKGKYVIYQARVDSDEITIEGN